MIANILQLVLTLALVGGAVNNDPSQAPAICAGLGSNDILIAHEDCSKFYICAWGKPLAVDCPKPLLYNAENKWCDWPANVNCNKAANICAAKNSDEVLVPHEICRKYYKCSTGKPFAYDCPPPLVYSIDKEICDWVQKVNCGNRI